MSTTPTGATMVLDYDAVRVWFKQVDRSCNNKSTESIYKGHYTRQKCQICLANYGWLAAFCEECHEQGCLQAVSYTHLDVYKRQEKRKGT